MSYSFFRISALFVVAALVGCGGGDDSPSDSQSMSLQSETAIERFSSLSSEERDAFMATGMATSSPDASLKHLARAAQVDAGEVVASEPAPTGCTMYFNGSFGLRCFSYGETLVTPVQGTDASTIAAKDLWCNEVQLGKVLYGVTPPAGGIACYQFSVSASTAVNYEVVLPAGISAVAELFDVQGSLLKPVSRAKTPAALTGSTVIQYKRLVLMVRTANGAGGEVFGFGLNAAVPQPLAANAVLTAARDIHINEEITSTLPSSLASAYYFFPSKIGQTQGLLTATFDPAKIQIAFRSAQRTGENSFVYATETALAPAQATGSPLVITSAYPANTATSTNITGTLVRVTGTDAATSAPAFQVRVGMKVINIENFAFTNTENISRYFPITGQLQAATHLVNSLQVKDDTGVWVKNAQVQLRILRFKDDVNSTQSTFYKTNFEGHVAASQVLQQFGATYPVTTPFAAACSGLLEIGTNYGPLGSPRDHWDGTAQQGTVEAILPGATAVLPKYAATSALKFTRICSETYRGYF